MSSTEIIQIVIGIIQTIAIVISLIYLAWQVRDSTKVAKSATYQSAINYMAELEARINDNAESTRIYRTGIKNRAKLTDDERLWFNDIMFKIFNLYQVMYYQYEEDLLESRLWTGWCKWMFSNLKQPGISEWWQKNRNGYDKSFRSYVDAGKCPEET